MTQSNAHLATLQARALTAWPEDVAEFRAIWAAPSVTDPEIRSAVAALTDEQIGKVSASLRHIFLKHPDEVGAIWQLAIDWAAEA